MGCFEWWLDSHWSSWWSLWSMAWNFWSQVFKMVRLSLSLGVFIAFLSYSLSDVSFSFNLFSIIVCWLLVFVFGFIFSSFSDAQVTISPSDHILTLRTLINEGRSHNKRIYCCFLDFRKAFDIVPRARLMQRQESLDIAVDVQWEISALYEFVLGKVWSPNGLSEAVASTIGVKQGCPLSPTLSGLYINEVSHYIERFGGSGARLTNIAIQILLYADDIVLISDSPERLKRHLKLKWWCLYGQRFVNQHG